MRRVSCLLVVCLLLVSMTATVWADGSVQSMIDGLPTVEEFRSMTKEEQVDAYNRTQYAYEAYMALPTAEEKEALEGAEEKFDALFSYFNAQIMPIESTEETGKVGYNQFAWVILVVVAVMLLLPVLGKKRT